MQNGENYSKLFRQPDVLYISDDQNRVYNLIRSEYITATRIQVYQIRERKRTFIEVQSGYTHDVSYLINGINYGSDTKTPYYYLEFISIYVDEYLKKWKEVGTGIDLPEEIWCEIAEIIKENFGNVRLQKSHLYGRCKKHRLYEVKEFQMAR